MQRVCLGVLLSLLTIGCGAAAQQPSRFEKGQTYVVVWGWQFEELLTVDVIASDGWLQVRDDDGLTWWVNTAQMLAVTPYERETPVK